MPAKARDSAMPASARPSTRPSTRPRGTATSAASASSASSASAAAEAAAAKATPRYAYEAPQPSLLFEFVLEPFYSWLTGFYPRWWTPNAITLFGIACTVLASMLVLSETYVTATDAASGAPASAAFGNVTDARSPSRAVWLSHVAASSDFAAGNASQPLSPFFNAAAPCWLLVAAGVLNLLYCVADNTDGKQARRLKLSSPIGEYLDHGLDCFSSLLSTFCLIIVGGGALHSGALYVVAMTVQTAMSHTLNYRRNIFIWGNRLVTVDEAMLTFGLLPLAAAAWPWLREVPLLATDYRAVEVIWFGLLLAQLQMIAVFVSRSLALLTDPIVWVAAANAAFFTWVAAEHGGGTAPHISAQFTRLHGELPAAWVGAAAIAWPPADSAAGPALAALPGVAAALLARVSLSYPALWAVAAACSASSLVHIPIAARCLAALRPPQLLLPAAAAAATAAAFYLHPLGGAAVGIVSHSCVNIVNIIAIKYNTKAK